MKTTARIGLLAFCIASGCSEKEPPPPPNRVAVVPRPAPASVKPAPAPAPAPAPVAPAASPVATVTAPAQPREQPMDLGSLDSILDNYGAQHDRVPKSLEEMVALKLIPRMPTPPPGKRYVIDQQKRRIRIVDR